MLMATSYYDKIAWEYRYYLSVSQTIYGNYEWWWWWSWWWWWTLSQSYLDEEGVAIWLNFDVNEGSKEPNAWCAVACKMCASWWCGGGGTTIEAPFIKATPVVSLLLPEDRVRTLITATWCGQHQSPTSSSSHIIYYLFMIITCITHNKIVLNRCY